MIYFRQNTCSQSELMSHLAECDFVPPLSTYADPAEYSNKLRQRSMILEAWNDEHELVAAVAAYVNDATRSTAFISNVSCIQRYEAQGIAGKLLDMCIRRVRLLGFERIQLEVFEGNLRAVHLYRRREFTVESKVGDKLLLELRFPRKIHV